MNIQFDIQILMDKHKTGVGRTAQKIIEGLAKTEKQNTYTLNYFALLRLMEKRSHVKTLAELGCRTNECRWFDSVAYRLLYNFVPIPYSLFFRENADITHFMNYHVPPGVKGKVVIMVYDMVYKVFPETMDTRTRCMLNLSMERSCGRADTIITVSQFSKNEIMKYMNVPGEKIAVMPCGVDMELYRPDYSPEDVQAVMDKHGISGEYFLYLGTLEPRKNIDRLIEAYDLLRKRMKTVPKLVIAGRRGWHYDTLFTKVHSLGLNDEVIFTGYVDEADSPVLMKGALAFVFPSIYEGFGMPPLEAMACGTPVITSNAASIPEVAGDAAVLTDPFSVESIKEAMEQMLMNESLRSGLSQKGIKRAAHFTWDRSVRIVSDVYARLANK